MKRMCWLFVVAVLGALPPGLRAQDKKEPAQWIVVTAPAFRDALAPLCRRRRAEGMRVVVVQTTDVLTARQLKEGDAGPLKDRVVALCKRSKGPSRVLLVGAVAARDPAVLLPPLRGVSGRMKGQPSDNAYGSVNQDLMPTVAVGRFPANTVEEARGMVNKTLAFEQDASPGPQRNRFTVIVGNPGGISALEKRFAESFVGSLVQKRFARLAGSPWTARTVVLMENSPYFVPKNKVREVSLRYLEEGQLICVYLGHSGWWGFSSGLGLQGRFIDREDWAKRSIPGIFFSCGCFGCQLKDGKLEGYGVAAMRNPRGPVAVIGAHGESYGAMGQFAIDGLLARTTRADPPRRLGDYWLGITRELATGKMDDLTFLLYDYGDGSRGTIPLKVQRREHLEMWMLLGDPGLKLPLRLPSIRLEATGPVAAGKTIKVRGTLPADFKGRSLRLTLERPMGSLPPSLPPLPREPDKQAEALMARHERANSLVLQTREVRTEAGSFETTLRLPAPLPWSKVVVRAFAATKEQSALGVLTLTANKP